ncbi:MAG: RtcB family protein, partial [Duodenibacillus sp.]|nr:RtcB family protein [Duodenibacillus sp.]
MIKTQDALGLGIPRLGDALPLALRLANCAVRDGADEEEVRSALAAVGRGEPVEGALAAALAPLAAEVARLRAGRVPCAPRAEPAPWRSWLAGGCRDPEAEAQMQAACRLPVSAGGALMPDAHKGYGLPIGGVLAVRGAVIPFAVGVDIACRMRLTVLDCPPGLLGEDAARFEEALQTQTRFGVGAAYEPGRLREHPVMDEDWSVSPV